MPEPTQPSPPPETPTRRPILKWLGLALGGLAGAALASPLVAYVVGPAFQAPADEWIPLGPVDSFPRHQTRLVNFDNPLSHPWDGMTGKASAYVRRLDGDAFHVFAVNCTHLGCPVSWFPQAGLFMCPCHGGVFYENGQHASGPPPRPLYSYPYRVENGVLQIHGGHLPTLHNTFQNG